MPRIKLTKKIIDKLPLPENPSGVRYYDESLRGFGVIVRPTGRKVFFLDYGKERHRMKLGVYGKLTLDQAKEKALEKFVAINDGHDPLAERKARNNAYTFGKWVEEYLEEVKLRKKHAREDVRYLGEAKKLWGKRPLTDVSTSDIQRVFSNKAKTISKTTANRWLASVRACLQDAWRQNQIEHNPAMRIKGFAENPGRTTVLTDDELVRTLKAIDALDDPHTRAAFHLLIQTGARKSEVLRAKWEDIDLEQRIWRIPTTKAGKPQVMPLPPEAVAMLEHLPHIGPYIIPGRNPKSPRSDLKRPWKTIQEEAGIAHVTIHDVRRTFGLHC